MERFVVIDLETTGHASNKQDKIIEVGIVVIEQDEITEQYATFINPNREIPTFITSLTGIVKEDLVDAPYFEEVADTISHKFKDSYFIAHNVPFDLGFLNDELRAIHKDPIASLQIDTVELARILYPDAPGYKLGQLASFLGIEHDYPHRALSDAYVTAEIFLEMKAKLKTLPIETLRHLRMIEPGLKSDLHQFITLYLDEQLLQPINHADILTYEGLAFRNHLNDEIDQPECQTLNFGSYLDDIYEEGGTLQRLMPHYQKRQTQREMSEIIFDAFQVNQHAIIEAETGTGKTLGYLLPAIYEGVVEGKPLVISTYTTQLQSQLLDTEIPLLQKASSFPFNVAILKGKKHYLSLEKLHQELHLNQTDNYDVALTKAILLVWITETTTGDIDEIQLPTSGYYFYKRISAEVEGNKAFQSPWSRYNYYPVARKKAEVANVIVTNHSLLCTDMILDYHVLPDFTKMIIDEAHHLEHTVSQKFGLSLDYIQIQSSLNQIGDFDDTQWLSQFARSCEKAFEHVNQHEWNVAFSDAKYETDELFRYLFQYVTQRQTYQKTFGDTGRLQYRFKQDKEDIHEWRIVKDMAARVVMTLQSLSNILDRIEKTVSNDESVSTYEKDQLAGFLEQFATFQVNLKHLFLEDANETEVKWIEIDAKGAKNAVYIYNEPTDVRTLMEEFFITKKESIILTSATLTMNDSFSFIQKRLGFDEHTITKKLASPFSYEKQVQLLIPNDFPDIQMNHSEDYTFAICEAILSLAEITKGRMLVLFTSYDMLKKTYHLLKEFMEENQYTLIAQGISSGSRERLKKNFQSIEQAILLGTNSFWEGVDIPGEDLSCVIITRLPFEPPTRPTFEAKAERLKNPFYELALPNAVLRFKQGFGRLIRSSTDRGIVFVCDARIKKSTYGKNFIKSIPEIPVIYDSTKELIDISRKWF